MRGGRGEGDGCDGITVVPEKAATVNIAVIKRGREMRKIKED